MNDSIPTPSRRGFLGGLAAGLVLTGCANPVGSPGPAIIDARVAQTLDYMYRAYPSSRSLADKSAGMLVMPVITEATLGIGGAYGRGALQVNGATVDYYSAAQASVGLQIGAQQYAHVLFFMTPEALQNFRTSPGFAAGAGVEYAVPEQGLSALASTTTTLSPVIGAVFGQQGLLAGASIEGTKYTRIIP